MAWDPTKPADNDNMFNSVGSAAIRGNFAAIDTAWDVNHIGIGDTNQGKHVYITLPETSAPTTAANEIALWSTDAPVTTTGTELYFKRESNGATWPITGARYVAGTAATDDGWSFLASGILIKWGVITGSGDGSYTFRTGTNYKAFTAVYRGFLQPRDATVGDTDVYVRLKNITTTTITYYASPRTTTGAKSVTFDWFVIGKGY